MTIHTTVSFPWNRLSPGWCCLVNIPLLCLGLYRAHHKMLCRFIFIKYCKVDHQTDKLGDIMLGRKLSFNHNATPESSRYQPMKGMLIARAYNSPALSDKNGSFQRHTRQFSILPNLLRKLVDGGVSHLSERLQYIYEPSERCNP